MNMTNNKSTYNNIIETAHIGVKKTTTMKSEKRMKTKFTYKYTIEYKLTAYQKRQYDLKRVQEMSTV